MKILVQTVFWGLMLVGCKTPSRVESNGNPQTKDLQNETKITQSESIIEKYWKLIELNGKQVELDDNTGGQGAFIILKNENNRFNGNTGCNTITGTYEIDPERNRIKFSQMATSLKACLNMEVEEELKKVLEIVDNYAVTSDGKQLMLNRARMAPLARFEVVYLQ